MRRSLGLLAFAMVGFVLADPASAQGVADDAAAWGLLGTWAVDCTRPASRANAYLSYVRKGKAVMHRRDLGDMQDEHVVTAAKVLPDGSLEIVIDLKSFSQVRTLVFEKQGEGKIRAVMNRDDAGNYSIKKGAFADGRPSPLQFRCGSPTG